jgi:hypothetical protein
MSLMPKSHDHRKELETVRRYSSVRWVFSRGLGGKDEISRRRTLCIAVLYGVDAHFYDGQYKSGMEHLLSDIIWH